MPVSQAASSTAMAVSSLIAWKTLPRFPPPNPSGPRGTPAPTSATGPDRVPGEGAASHLGACPWGRRRAVAAVPHIDRGDEVLVQVVDELDHPAVEAAGHGDEVEHRKVLHP